MCSDKLCFWNNWGAIGRSGNGKARSYCTLARRFLVAIYKMRYWLQWIRKKLIFSWTPCIYHPVLYDIIMLDMCVSWPSCTPMCTCVRDRCTCQEKRKMERCTSNMRQEEFLHFRLFFLQPLVDATWTHKVGQSNTNTNVIEWRLAKKLRGKMLVEEKIYL